MPNFRYNVKKILKYLEQLQGLPITQPSIVIKFQFLEPVGSSSPNIHGKDIRVKTTAINLKKALHCEGQGFPAPVFRYF